EKLPPVPQKHNVIAIKQIKLTKKASLFAGLGQPVISAHPLCFEDLNQGYGFVLYRTKLKNAATGILKIKQMRDYATIYIDGNRSIILDRRDEQDALHFCARANTTLNIVVENDGRMKY